MKVIKMVAGWGAVLLALVLTSQSATFAQLKVMISGGVAAPYEELIPAFEKSSNVTVTTTRGASQGSDPSTIPSQLHAGVLPDVVIMSKEGMGDLIAEGRILVGSNVDLAEAPLGVAVRAGLRKPDISTVEAFKQTLLRAKSINVISTTGIYLTEKLFPKLGVAAEVASRLDHSGLAALSTGDVELTLRPVSEILHLPGMTFVGTVPDEIQFLSVFSAGIVSGSKQLVVSRRFIAFFTSDRAKATFRRSGMEPASVQ